MKTTILLTVALLSCGVAVTAFAHDTWLIPEKFNVAPKATVTLNMTSGMEFPKLDAALKPERVQTAKCRLGAQVFDLAQKIAGPHSLQFKSELTDAAVATIWVSLAPRALELKPDEVKHYLEEVDAPAALRQEWTEMKEQRWRESYSKHTKTFVRVGAPKEDRSWAEPVGAPLEIVPEKDPTALRPGEAFPVRVMKNGEPFADFSLNAVAAGETKGETRKTDAAGRVMFQLGKSGRWMLRGTDIRKSTAPDTDWESDFTTLTIEVAKK
jgi:uncharacterized GH25 family protein